MHDAARAGMARHGENPIRVTLQGARVSASLVGKCGQRVQSNDSVTEG